MASEYKKIISDKKNEAVIVMTNKQFRECNIAIHTAAVAAGAGGVMPIPVMDSIPISAAQITMVVALGKIFDQKITESAAKGIIGAAASTLIGRRLVKLIPIAGWIASAAVAAGVTEAIGWSIAVDFAKMSQRTENTEKSEAEHTIVKDDDANINEECDTESEVTVEDSTEEETGEFDDESIANDFSKAFGEENV